MIRIIDVVAIGKTYKYFLLRNNPTLSLMSVMYATKIESVSLHSKCPSH